MPFEQRLFWRKYKIILEDDLHLPVYSSPFYVVVMKVPAGMDSENNIFYLDPQWACGGICAHEFCHESYSFLTDEQKAQFEVTFKEELKTNKLLQYAWETKPRMRDNMVEAQADCYRYLGAEMPESLKGFYINLF